MIIIQAVASRTALFYCILLKMNFSISFHISVTLNVTMTVY